MCSFQKLNQPVEEWEFTGLPLTMMMDIEERKGNLKPVIRKTLVDLNGPAFRYLSSMRNDWMLEDKYLFPGPIQFFGPSSITDEVPLTMQIEHVAEYATA